jgi:hypothetical protein
MTYTTEELLDRLVSQISSLPMVQSVGLSGTRSPLPKAGESDMDLFIYCSKIPSLKERQTVLDTLSGIIGEGKTNMFQGGRWGHGDFAMLNGVETWLMHFTVEETLTDVESILNGEQPDMLDNYYYPVGRLAMLKNITVLFDRSGFLSNLKKHLLTYPEKLRDKLTVYHLNKLHDPEDLCRAVTRKDVFFYHFALDNALDHYLQALFAMNSTYFPSRKRTIQFLSEFAIQPKDCAIRLIEVLRLGGEGETVPQSFSIFQSLTDELLALGSSITGTV